MNMSESFVISRISIFNPTRNEDFDLGNGIEGKVPEVGDRACC